MALLNPANISAVRGGHTLRVPRRGGEPVNGAPADGSGAGAAGPPRINPLSENKVGQQVRVPKTAELVAAQLRRQIVRGELVEGDALPPEAVLMEQFGVSRPTLREAFRVLESEALISVRRGAHGGARVHTPDGQVAARYAGLVLEHRHTTVADVHTAHTLLEPAAVRLLATHHTDTTLTALHTALTHPDPNHFHHQLLEHAGNQTLTMIAGMLRHILDTHTPPPHPAPHNHHDHTHLLDLITHHEPDAAETHWRTHIATTPTQTPTIVLDLLGE
ncbi:GntR family transcriptional regulator [Parafrankia colletiae]|uniref:GntR family transcriptional regulator n=1 Tax=Parafrankia colletiae TaxID=573497 RepID=A0A1S1RIW5_9ACTN|nr:GntR family transcriptional regulator [Parafrankia colletiae]OHV46150.1 GntR family transcriptional regulator [Parafrankia colletiae]